MDVEKLKQTTLTQAPAEKAFWSRSGHVITNVKDLAEVVESMEPAHFQHHIAADKGHSDFAAWVKDVFENHYLSNDLTLQKNLEDQQHCAKTNRDHLSWLEHA